MDNNGSSSEIQNFIKVWVVAATALTYCYYVVSRLPKGAPRLISVLPVLYLFAALPLQLRSFHLGATTAFLLLWLSNSHLLLLSFSLGPLHPPPPSLLRFIVLACLPIRVNDQIQIREPPRSLRRTAAKAALAAALFQIYDYKQHMHPYLLSGLYAVHVYLQAELIFFLCESPARVLLGLELGPSFNGPFSSTSLQDFWGRRWNLVVTGLLRASVYDPLRRRAAGPAAATMATFAVSGVMHEAVFYYITRARPTWEVTWFFLLHGVCTAAEAAVKRRVGGRWRLHGAVSGVMTVAFVAVTGVWLFLPQLVRNGVDEKAIGEYKAMVSFMCRVGQIVQLQLKYLYDMIFQ